MYFKHHTCLILTYGSEQECGSCATPSPYQGVYNDKCRIRKTTSLVAEEAALRVLGVHIPPIRQDERQVGHTTLQQPPQVLSHKLISLL